MRDVERGPASSEAVHRLQRVLYGRRATSGERELGPRVSDLRLLQRLAEIDREALRLVQALLAAFDVAQRLLGACQLMERVQDATHVGHRPAQLQALAVVAPRRLVIAAQIGHLAEVVQDYGERRPVPLLLGDGP